MTISIYGAFRTDTTMSDNTATYATIGATFQINAYSQIDITDGADGSIIDGDDVTNESPNDPTQTYGGNAILWDYTISVNDGTNNYQIGVIDYDINGNGSNQYPGAEQGYFLGFIGSSIPPLGVTLTIGTIVDNGPSIPVTTVVPCFVAGSLIDTPNGPRAIEHMVKGDQVLTADNGAQTIRWIGSRTLDLQDWRSMPKLRPIMIGAGTLGKGLPKRDLHVSPQHRMLVQSAIAERMFSVNEVLIPANKLLGMPGIKVDTAPKPVTYFHVLLDRHEIIFAEGAATESLFVGKEALRAVGEDAFQEIQTLFPQITKPGYRPESARHMPEKGHKIKSLVRRHVENQRPLVTQYLHAASGI